MKNLKRILVLLVVLVLLPAVPVFAAVGDLLATVTLPGNGNCNVGIATDGNVVVVVNGTLGVPLCASSSLQVYDPPAGNGAAALVATKTVKVAGVPTTVSGGLGLESELPWAHDAVGRLRRQCLPD